jgi:predicted transcriptional regulator of viral defense system
VRANGSPWRIEEYVDSLQARGRYTFLGSEARAAMGILAPVFRRAAIRLGARGRLVMPRRGFFVIVPLEYREAGAPPASWFIDDLMRHLGRPYYVGLLSAAALHGAAHQQPQETQVVTDRPQRPIEVGRTRIRFLVRRDHAKARVSEVRTSTGTMRVSSPETTALDLLRYVRAAGGLDNVASVIAELSERMDPDRLKAAAEADGEAPAAQRLGALLARVGAESLAAALEAGLAPRRLRVVPLRPGRSWKDALVDSRWRVAINEDVEVEP